MIARISLSFLAASILYCSVAKADGPPAGSFPLNDEYRIETSVDEASSVATITLFYRDRLHRSISVGNAGIDENDVVFAKLCAECERVLFIPAYDLTSNFGATTGIVAWQRFDSWDFSILPSSRPYLEDKDGDGISVLMGGDQQYDLHEGLISVVP